MNPCVEPACADPANTGEQFAEHLHTAAKHYWQQNLVRGKVFALAEHFEDLARLMNYMREHQCEGPAGAGADLLPAAACLSAAASKLRALG